MELGLFSFVDATPDPNTGAVLSAEERTRRLLEEVELAEAVGLDVFGIGEHHRPDYVASAPAVLLAAAAARTRRIRLTSAVTVLSSDDPVRVFQQFATLDLVSGGRAEIMAGRGSFTESFPLFGQSLSDYDALFAEKLDLLLRLRETERVTWSGQHRAALEGQGVYPRPVQAPLPVWIAVGGTPASVVRAGHLGLPLALAIIGGEPARFAPFVRLYREAARESGHDAAALPVGVNLHGLVADTDAAARDTAFPAFSAVMNRIGRERGWPPLSRAAFDASCALDGANLVGRPETLVEKLLFHHRVFGHQRILVQMGIGAMPHDALLRSIELFGKEVAPAVRDEVARRQAAGERSLVDEALARA